MRILLDESLPRDLAGFLVPHEVATVSRAGWSGIKNGKLLALAATQFDVFLTADQKLEFQQNLATHDATLVYQSDGRSCLCCSRRTVPARR